jgi:hypothetical protein
MSSNTYYRYTYFRSVSIPSACEKYIQDNFPAAIKLTITTEQIDVITNVQLTAAQQLTLDNLVSAYVDPSSFLDVNHPTIENTPMLSTAATNSNVDMHAITVIPRNSDPANVINSLKTTASYTCSNPETFSNVTLTNPVQFALRVKDYSHSNVVIGTVVSDITSEITQQWIPLATAGSNTLPTIYKPLEVTGLGTSNPTTESIWVFNGSINNSNVSVSLNNLQKKTYNIYNNV